uniref:Uncharacterized protein n=1 Tax=Knipowitschia caucasica TaxID=637954 RepID=A0AAV2MBS5_KNICA
MVPHAQAASKRQSAPFRRVSQQQEEQPRPWAGSEGRAGEAARQGGAEMEARDAPAATGGAEREERERRKEREEREEEEEEQRRRTTMANVSLFYTDTYVMSLKQTFYVCYCNSHKEEKLNVKVTTDIQGLTNTYIRQYSHGLME